ncbi:MAG: cobalt ECF transporter T component CbiQ [Candidatus Thiodiazotropha sp.]
MSAELLALGVPESWLSRREPRLRILTALGFALMTVSLQRLSLVLLALALAFGLALSSGLSPRLILRRLLALEGFMLVLLLLLPFSLPGETLWRVGPFPASREGALLALTILFKANAVVLALLALVGTLDAVTLGHALARLRLPDKLVHLLLFTVRYLGVLNEEYRRLRLAMRTRGFRARSDLHTWRSLGWLMGMLLVRSLERAQRIVAAMKCRGFNGRFYLIDGRPWRSQDTLFALCGLLILSAFLFLDLMS